MMSTCCGGVGRKKWVHDPQARLDYTWDWKPEDRCSWLNDDETIVEAIVTADPELSIDADFDETTVTAWVAVLSDRTPVSRRMTAHIVTSQGRKDDRTITLRIDQR